MAEMLLVNPRRRRRRKGTRRRAGRRAMTAKQLRYFGPRRRRRVAAATRRRSRRRVSRRISRVRRNPVAVMGRRRRSSGRRMGSLNLRSIVNDTLIPSGIGAIGAIGVDAAMSYAGSMLPPFLQTGVARSAVKVAAAIGIGYVAGMIGGRRFGEQAMSGAITVTMYELIRPYAVGVIPGVAGYDMGWVSPALQVGSYVGVDDAYSGMGAYVGESESDYYAGGVYSPQY